MRTARDPARRSSSRSIALDGIRAPASRPPPRRPWPLQARPAPTPARAAAAGRRRGCTAPSAAVPTSQLGRSGLTVPRICFGARPTVKRPACCVNPQPAAGPTGSTSPSTPMRTLPLRPLCVVRQPQARCCLGSPPMRPRRSACWARASIRGPTSLTALRCTQCRRGPKPTGARKRCSARGCKGSAGEPL